MSFSKNNVLDKTNITYVPDLSESVKKRNTTRSNSQTSEQNQTEIYRQPVKYSIRQNDIQSHKKNGFSGNMELNLYNETQQIYQRMNDLYIAREVKLKLKNQEKQIKNCIYNKKKENLLKNSFVKLMSLKLKQFPKGNKNIKQSKFVFQEFDSFRKVI